MLVFLMIVAGLGLLLVGGDTLVKGAVKIAKRFQISPMVIGIVLVGFGTSSPELITSLIAAFKDAPGIAVGNVVGSNIANILLILGVTATITPIAIQKGMGFKQDVFFLGLSSLMLVSACLFGTLNQWAGLAFIIGLAAYITLAFRRDAAQEHVTIPETAVANASAAFSPLWRDLVLFTAGLAATMMGAKLLVDGSVTLARDFGISETIIGLTIVAVGTSLPELVASVIAALRKHADIAYGNIIGSNIYNVFGILGITAIIKPIAIPQQIISMDIWIMCAVTLGLILLVRWGWVLSRWKAVMLLSSYIAYSIYLASLTQN